MGFGKRKLLVAGAIAFGLGVACCNSVRSGGEERVRVNESLIFGAYDNRRGKLKTERVNVKSPEVRRYSEGTYDNGDSFRSWRRSYERGSVEVRD